jgi:hypothetical protein
MAARAQALGQQITTVHHEAMPSISRCLACNTPAWYVERPVQTSSKLLHFLRSPSLLSESTSSRRSAL